MEHMNITRASRPEVIHTIDSSEWIIASFFFLPTLSCEYSIQLMASILRRGCINSIIRSYILVGSMTRDVVKERSQRVRPEIMESFQSHGPVEVGHAYFITRSFFVCAQAKQRHYCHTKRTSSMQLSATFVDKLCGASRRTTKVQQPFLCIMCRS